MASEVERRLLTHSSRSSYESKFDDSIVRSESGFGGSGTKQHAVMGCGNLVCAPDGDLPSCSRRAIERSLEGHDCVRADRLPGRVDSVSHKPNRSSYDVLVEPEGPSARHVCHYIRPNARRLQIL